jgi:hypothetical protein
VLALKPISKVQPVAKSLGFNLTMLTLRLSDFEGWKALGYSNLRECALAEFKFTLRHTNRLINAVEVLDDLDQIGPKPDNDGQLRELAKLRIQGLSRGEGLQLGRFTLALGAIAQ